MRVLKKIQNSWSFKKWNKLFCWSALLLSNTPMNRRVTKILLKEKAWKLYFFWLKHASIGWWAEQSGATKSSHIDGGMGAMPLSLGDFLIFPEKNNYFNAIWITFRTFLKLFERIKLLRLKSQWKIKFPWIFSPYVTYRLIQKHVWMLAF